MVFPWVLMRSIFRFESVIVRMWSLSISNQYEYCLFLSANLQKVGIDPGQDIALVPHSSGTTGLPKGVVLTHRNCVAAVCSEWVIVCFSSWPIEVTHYVQGLISIHNLTFYIPKYDQFTPAVPVMKCCVFVIRNFAPSWFDVMENSSLKVFYMLQFISLLNVNPSINAKLESYTYSSEY